MSRTRPRKTPPARPAESPRPPGEPERAIEARLDELLVEAVRDGFGGLSDEEARVLAEAARARPGDHAPDLRWLGRCRGVLSGEEMRELELELQLRLPGAAHGYEPSLPAPGPTDAEPGSDEKIRVMRRRLLKRQGLHHPLDKKLAQGLFDAGLPAPGRPATPPETDP